MGVSALIFTLNEEINLPHCLGSLGWCDDIVVVDSFSSDKTEVVCKAAGARFYQRAFDGFGTQRNWALENIELKNRWVLILDADERVPPELARELLQRAKEAPNDVGAYRVRRRFYMWGRWLRYSSLYPTWVVRFVRVGRVTYVNRGHAETEVVQGVVGQLEHDLIDEDHKGISAWFERQNQYARKDAEYELNNRGRLRARDFVSRDPLTRRAAIKRLASRLPFRGSMYFLYSYVFRRGFLDGRDGFVFCVMRAMYQSQVQVRLYDAKRRSGR